MKLPSLKYLELCPALKNLHENQTKMSVNLYEASHLDHK